MIVGEPTATESLLLLSIVLTLSCCALTAYAIYKLRQVHVTLYGADQEIRRTSLSITRNLQSLHQLQHELALDRPLPLLRGWAASPDVLLLLARRIRQARPARIVECGSGVSTIVQAQAAKLNGCGHVLSFEHDAAFAAQTRQALRQYDLADWATVTHAPLRRSRFGRVEARWYDPAAFVDITAIDQLFIDGPPADAPQPLSRYPAGPVLFPLLSPGASVFVDDAARPGEQQMLRAWGDEFRGFEQLHHDCEKGCAELRHRAATVPASQAPFGSSVLAPDRKVAVE